MTWQPRWAFEPVVVDAYTGVSFQRAQHGPAIVSLKMLILCAGQEPADCGPTQKGAQRGTCQVPGRSLHGREPHRTTSLF